VADAAMGQAYAALPKEAPDPEIRAMLASSQRRWTAACNDGLGWRCHPVGEINRAMVERPAKLSDRSDKRTCRAGSGTMQSSSGDTVG